jgi:hypothetical protein
MKLADVISIDRRYSRSVNLERDMSNAASMAGYVLSDRNYGNLARILTRTCVYDQPRAWTITGLYGTGKSAFINVLLGLFAASDSPVHAVALQTLRTRSDCDARLLKVFRSRVGAAGLVRAAATASREPLTSVIVRALYRGATEFWEGARGARPAAYTSLLKLHEQVLRGTPIPSDRVLRLMLDLASASRSGIVLVIDELGKCLEHAASRVERDDLYLLQQLAELPASKNSPKVIVIGVLHQAFGEYAQTLTNIQQQEWSKVQGRFEDIPFHESPVQLTKLIAHAISRKPKSTVEARIRRSSQDWHRTLRRQEMFAGLSSSDFASLYPLHPTAAVVLPYLAERFAQNDRSVFAFLASDEPHSLKTFLALSEVNSTDLPLLKVHHLYDYFVETLGLGMSNHRLFQRWAEIQATVTDAESLGWECQCVLKTIGVLNLISTASACRATPETVLCAMADDPDPVRLKQWERILSDLKSNAAVNFRRQVNELRIWHGTDFDFEAALDTQLSRMESSDADLLGRYWQLSPVVASRHSYATGTLRFFERRFLDHEQCANPQFCPDTSADGLLYYWIDQSDAPIETVFPSAGPKPIVVLVGRDTLQVHEALREFVALTRVFEQAPEVRTDGVARKELVHRIRLAKEVLDTSIQRTFQVSHVRIHFANNRSSAWSSAAKSLSALCSDLCNQAYLESPVLANELINRKALTTQAAKARRELIEYMVEREGQPRLGIGGYGPERSIFESVFSSTGIYREREGRLAFGPPYEKSGVSQIWAVAESFCINSQKVPRNLGELYDLLQRPPYGMRSELIPLFLVAVILGRSEDVVLYCDGSFVPVLTTANLEVLVKHPDRFAVMYFEMTGARKRLFDKLESVLNVNATHVAHGTRNLSLLGVLKPLIRFTRGLPSYTVRTRNLSEHALATRDALLNGRHPDRLVFEQLPEACGLPPIDAIHDHSAALDEFKTRFSQALHVLDTAYDSLLARNREKLCKALAIQNSPGRLQEHLRVRSSSLLAITVEPRLRRFLTAAVEAGADEHSWLESLSMVISDKPVQTWSDDDERLFDVQVNEIARRFINLEALDKAMTARFEHAYDARRVVVTKPDGTEGQRVLWLEQDMRPVVESIVSCLISENEALSNIETLQAVVAVLLDQLLEMPDTKSIKSENVKAKVRKLNG